MYDNWPANTTVVVASLAAVALCVLVHYEGLLMLLRSVTVLQLRHNRIKVLYSILAVVALHVVEIWIFGLTLWLLLQWPAVGHIAGQDALHLFDAIYLSAVTYTTVGYGDIAPVGPIRLLAGTEALVGLVLITWSASFTYLEMQRDWHRE